MLRSLTSQIFDLPLHSVLQVDLDAVHGKVLVSEIKETREYTGYISLQYLLEGVGGEG